MDDPVIAAPRQQASANDALVIVEGAPIAYHGGGEFSRAIIQGVDTVILNIDHATLMGRFIKIAQSAPRDAIITWLVDCTTHMAEHCNATCCGFSVRQEGNRLLVTMEFRNPGLVFAIWHGENTEWLTDGGRAELYLNKSGDSILSGATTATISKRAFNVNSSRRADDGVPRNSSGDREPKVV